MIAPVTVTGALALLWLQARRELGDALVWIGQRIGGAPPPVQVSKLDTCSGDRSPEDISREARTLARMITRALPRREAVGVALTMLEHPQRFALLMGQIADREMAPAELASELRRIAHACRSGGDA